MIKPIDKSYVEETIKVIRPANTTHFFDEVNFDKVETQESDGTKLVILRKKEK